MPEDVIESKNPVDMRIDYEGSVLQHFVEQTLRVRLFGSSSQISPSFLDNTLITRHKLVNTCNSGYDPKTPEYARAVKTVLYVVKV